MGNLQSIAIGRYLGVCASFSRTVRILVVVLLALLGNAAHAQTAGSAGTGTDPALAFDHATTGFVLTGQHIQARCESCHAQGVFRGTPRDCASCHRNATRFGATQFPVKHIPTTQACDTCHRTVAWDLVIFRHHGIEKGTCLTCHDGLYSAGKPVQHIATIASCDTCHNTLTWTATTFDHSGVAAGTCDTCHNGNTGTGKPTSHIPTTAACDTCHTPAQWKPAKFSHDAATVGKCSTCHNGATALGKGRTHIPDNRQCDVCHTSTTSFLVRSMNHTGLSGQCATCHNGGYLSENAQSKSPSHIATTQQCDDCHKSTTTWATATFNHAAASPPVTIGDHQCATCHKSGGTGLPKPTNHIPTNNACDICHTNFAAFRPAAMSHDGTAGQCSTCHSGTYVAIGSRGAAAKPVTHVATSAQCDTCHTTAAWQPAYYPHDASAARRCSVCHNGNTAKGMDPVSHIPDNRQCDTCHTSTTSFLTVTMNHTGLDKQCSTCHSGKYVGENAQTWSTSHKGGNPPAGQCDDCHKSTLTWATTSIDHSKFTPPVTVGDHTCANCHKNGGTGLPKPSGTQHIPTTQACDVCHTNFNIFKPAFMNHTGTAGQCSTCHSGGYTSMNAEAWNGAAHAGGNPPSGQCDACHSTTAWKPASYTHGPTSVGKCSTCHDGISAKGKGSRHIPDNRQCDTCHTSTSSFLVATMNHTGLARQCSTCHSGGYVSQNAQTWSATHKGGNPPAQCDDCHKSTTTWATTSIDHSKFAPPVVVGDHTCANCHKNGGTGLPKPGNHIPTSAACDTCHTNFASFSPATMNHTGTAGLCSTCHDGTYTAVNAQTWNGAAHAGGNPPAQCDNCHKITTAWKPASFTHDASTVGKCSTCHNGTTAKGIDSSHIPDNRQCDVCHTSTTSFLSVTMNHAGLNGKCSTCHSGGYVSENAQTWSGATHKGGNPPAQCDNCHKSTTTWATATTDHAKFTPPVVVGDHTCANCHKNGGTGLPKPGTHIPTTQACDTCHTNFTAFKPAAMNHTGTAAQCSTCHSGGYTGANAQTWNGAAHLGGNPPAQCDNCHKITTAWKPASFTHGVSSLGKCSTCHNNTTAKGKDSSHIPDNRQCDVCHTSTTSFLAVTMSHTGLAGQCSVCHSGGFVSENAQTWSVTHKGGNAPAQCDNCHKSTTTWATATTDHSKFVPPVVIGGHTCANCHKTGGTGLPKPGGHIPTTQACDTCHTNFTAFKPATMNHTGTAAQCSTCHSGGYTGANAQTWNGAAHLGGNPPAQCDNCHKITTAWKPASFTHGVSSLGKCSTCHNNTTAKGKDSSHIPDNRQCDVCHTSTTSFLAVTMSHAGLAGQCSVCHSGAYVSENAQTWSATHKGGNAPAQCDICHKSTTTWATASTDHSKFTPPVIIGGHTCANCHVAGGTGLPKPGSHIPTTGFCDTCHTNFNLFKPAAMNHTGTANQCSSCHNGSYTGANAQTYGSTHKGGYPTTSQCDVCHHITTAWSPASFAHGASTAGQCLTCHNGTTATGKPASKHIPTSQVCDVCHRTTAWLPLLTPYGHAGVAAGSCATCHTAPYTNIDVKPVGSHIPTSAACDACHRTTAWLPLKTPYAHTGIAAGTCTTCHTAPYTNITIMPSGKGHIPTTAVTMNWASCDACHKSYSTFSGVRLHGTVYTSASQYPGKCPICHELGAGYGLEERVAKEHTSTARKAPNSCDNSGCHTVRGF